MKIGRVRAIVTFFLFLILGLVLLLLGQMTKDFIIFSVEVGNLMSSFGALVLFVLATQWVLDQHMRGELIEDVYNAALRASEVVSAKIVRYVRRSTDLNNSDDIQTAPNLIVAMHYSSDFITRHAEALVARCERGLPTTMLVSKPDGAAVKFLSSSEREVGHIQPNIKKIVSRLREFSDGRKGEIAVKFHDSVLRYSFVYCENYVWIKFYRNSKGVTNVPALKVQKGSDFFEFFEQDIISLVNASSEAV